MKRSFLIGLTTGLVIASASFVLANTQIQAILNNQIKVTLNGQVQEFRDETSNEIQYPITYKDRTYLPLRTVANLVGVNVDYDANSNTAILTNKHNSNSQEMFINAVINNKVQVGLEYIFTHESADGTYFGMDILDGSNKLHNGEIIKIVSIKPGEWFISPDTGEKTRFVDYEIQRENGEIVIIGEMAGRT